MRKLNKNKYFINGIVVFIYFLVLWNLKTGINEDIMFSTVDAKTYLAVSEWLTNGIETESTETRPFLYPLLISLSSKLGGVHGIWAFHFLLWLLTMNLTFWSIHRLTGTFLYAYIGTLVLATNLSLIALTLHALTEITITFFLAALVFFIVKNIRKRDGLYFIHGCILFLVLMTVIKPVFLIPLLFVLLIILPTFYRKKYLASPAKIFLLMVLLLPLITQVTLMKVKHNSFSVSTIGSKAFTKYFLARGIQKMDNSTRIESIEKAYLFSPSERMDFLLKHKVTYILLYFSNLKENVKANPIFLAFPEELTHSAFMWYMKRVNRVYYYLHFIFIIPVFMMAFSFFKEKKYDELTLSLSMIFLTAYYILITGLSFWQGDRLVLPSISIWLCLYCFTIMYFVKERQTSRG